VIFKNVETVKRSTISIKQCQTVDKILLLVQITQKSFFPTGMSASPKTGMRAGNKF
jgi:hypothetical protein